MLHILSVAFSYHVRTVLYTPISARVIQPSQVREAKMVPAVKALYHLSTHLAIFNNHQRRGYPMVRQAHEGVVNRVSGQQCRRFKPSQDQILRKHTTTLLHTSGTMGGMMVLTHPERQKMCLKIPLEHVCRNLVSRCHWPASSDGMIKSWRSKVKSWIFLGFFLK